MSGWLAKAKLSKVEYRVWGWHPLKLRLLLIHSALKAIDIDSTKLRC